METGQHVARISKNNIWYFKVQKTKKMYDDIYKFHINVVLSMHHNNSFWSSH
jgi:hypothetical protein